MGQVLHGSARTTAAIRRAIQHSQESLQSLAIRFSINPKTVAKWRKRPTAQDARMGPEPTSMVFNAEQEAIAVAFRRHTLLALDDCRHPVRQIYNMASSICRKQWRRFRCVGSSDSIPCHCESERG